jgi:hypothetical protein
MMVYSSPEFLGVLRRYDNILTCLIGSDEVMFLSDEMERNSEKSVKKNGSFERCGFTYYLYPSFSFR